MSEPCPNATGRGTVPECSRRFLSCFCVHSSTQVEDLDASPLQRQAMTGSCPPNVFSVEFKVEWIAVDPSIPWQPDVQGRRDSLCVRPTKSHVSYECNGSIEFHGFGQLCFGDHCSTCARPYVLVLLCHCRHRQSMVVVSCCRPIRFAAQWTPMYMPER